MDFTPEELSLLSSGSGKVKQGGGQKPAASAFDPNVLMSRLDALETSVPAPKVEPPKSSGFLETMGSIDPAQEFIKDNSDPEYMNGSVMNNVPAAAFRPGRLVRPDVRRSIEAQYDAATPEQRAEMAGGDTVYADVARERDGAAASLDAANKNMPMASETPVVSDMLDPRAEARSRRLAKDGLSPELTESWGRTAARRGDAIGQEVGSIQTGNAPEFFDISDKYNKDMFYSNPLVRAGAKTANAFNQGILGLNQFAAESIGATDWAEGFAKRGAKYEMDNSAIGEGKTPALRRFESVAESIGQQLPILIGGAITGSEALVLGSMFMQSFGQEYAKGRASGLDHGAAAARGGVYATGEVLGEMLPVGGQLKGLRAIAKGDVRGTIAHLGKAGVKEIPGEMSTTTIQAVGDTNPAFGLNKDLTQKEFLGQIGDTIVNTMLQSMAMAGGGMAASKGVQKVRQWADANQPAQPLPTFMLLAQSSPEQVKTAAAALHQLDPDSAAAVIDKVREHDPALARQLSVADPGQSTAAPEFITATAIQMKSWLDGSTVSATTPEAKADIAAQIKAMSDPANPKDTVFVATGNESAIPEKLPQGVMKAQRPEGTLLTTSQGKFDEFTSAYALADSDIARLLGIPETKETAMAGQNQRIVQAKDAQGNVVAGAVTSDNGQGANEAAVAAQAPPGGTVETVTPEAAQAERAAKVQQESQMESVVPGVADDMDALLQDVPVVDEQGNPVQTGAQAVPEPVAAPLRTRQSLPTHQARVAAMWNELDRAAQNETGDADAQMQRVGVRVLDENTAPAPLVKLAAALKEALGIDTIFVHSKGALKTSDGHVLQAGFPEGISLAGSKTIVINTAAQQRNILNLLGHELTHQLKMEHPAIYARLEKVALSRISAEKKAEMEAKYGKAEARDELVAEAVGEQMQDPKFWVEVFKDQPKDFVQRIMSVISEMLDKLTKAMTKNAYVTGAKDVQVLRNAISKAYGEWAAKNTVAKEQAAAPAQKAVETVKQKSQGVDKEASKKTAKTKPAVEKVFEKVKEKSKRDVSKKQEKIDATEKPVEKKAKDKQVKKQPKPAVTKVIEKTKKKAEQKSKKAEVVEDDFDGLDTSMEDELYNDDPIGTRYAKRKAPESDVGHKREKASGRYVGAPDWVGNSPPKLAVLRQILRKLALEGERGRYWYENSSKAILEMVNGNKEEAERIVALIAIYSPNATVPANTSMALKAYLQFKSGQEIKAGTGDNNKKATDLLAHGKEWSGIKTNNFYQNLMVEIDPSKLDPGSATMDMWMALAFDYGSKTLDQGPKYNFALREINDLAKKIGWHPHQVQAAIWTAIKGRVEASEKVRKEYELKTGIAVIAEEADEATGKKKKTHSIVKGREYDHYRTATKFGMEHKLSADDINTAKYDFSDALKERAVQISWEAKPGKKSGVLPGIFKAAWNQQLEYFNAIAKALTDKDGRDIISKVVGIHTRTSPGVSGWDGEVGYGAQDILNVSPPNGFVDPAAVTLIDLASDIRGLVLQQEGVAWHFPNYKGNKSEQNGINVELGRPLTIEEADKLYQALIKEFGHSYAPPIHTETGFRLLNFPDAKFALEGDAELSPEQRKQLLKESRDSNNSFEIAAKRAILEVSSIERDVSEIKRFQSDGKLLENDWSRGGYDYRQRISEAAAKIAQPDENRWAGRSDIFEWIDGELYPRIESVNKEFSERYGWGDYKLRFARSSEDNGHRRGSIEGLGHQAPQVAVRERQADALPAQLSIHYGKVGDLTELNGAKNGTGISGREQERLKYTDDERIKKRVYFYPHDGSSTLPRKEPGLGRHVYAASLNNLYDRIEDPKRIWEQISGIRDSMDRINALESAIVSHGYDGYTAGGMTVVFADAVPVKYMGDEKGDIRFARIQPPETKEFKTWFGSSKIVDAAGKAKLMFHGTARDITQFIAKQANAIFVTEAPVIAETFADLSVEWMAANYKALLSPAQIDAAVKQAKQDVKANEKGADRVYQLKAIESGPLISDYLNKAIREQLDTGMNIMPVWVKAENPFDYENPDHVRKVQGYLKNNGMIQMSGLADGSWRAIEHDDTQDAIRALGFDGFYVKEMGQKNLAVYDPTQLKSATGNNGKFDGSNPDIRYARAKETRGDNFTIGKETIAERIQSLFQDNFNRVKKTQKAVLNQGGIMDEASDIYGADERYSGAAASKVGYFTKHTVLPLIRDMAKAGIAIHDLAFYMYARHAKERNAYIASINPHMPDGGSGMTNAEANIILQAYRQSPDFAQIQAFARRFDAITKATRQTMIRGGLVAPEVVAEWESAYKSYVPLKGFEDFDDRQDGRPGVGRKYDVRGKDSLRAMGRTSRAGQIIENIIMDHERAIVRAEKNKVARALLRFVRQNPDRGLWEVNKVITKPTMKDGEVDYYYKREDNKDRTVVAKVDGKDFHIVIKDQGLFNQLTGSESSIFSGILSHPAMRAWATINRTLVKFWTALNPVFMATNFARDYLTAAINGGAQYGAKFTARTARLTFQMIPAIIKVERSDNPVAIPATGPVTNEQWYQQYMDDGGKAGFYIFSQLEDKERELKALFKEAEDLTTGGKRAAKRRAINAVKATEDLIMDYNAGIENGVRVAAYRTAIEQGKSRAEAASIAKNLTVNFNRKGIMSSFMGSVYLFFNPAIQGVAQIAKVAKHNPKTFGTLVSGLVALGLMAGMLGGDDKDEEGVPHWENVPGYEKQKNLVLMTGGGNRINIPLAYGYGFFVNLGYAISDMMRGRNMKVIGGELLDAALQHWSPVNVSENKLMLITPTALAPLVEQISNKKGTGIPLRPEDHKLDGSPVPDSERYWGKTRGTLIEQVTTWLNEATGGDKASKGLISISPEVAKNYVSGYFGGFGTFIMDAVNSVHLAATIGIDEPFKQDTLPFARQLFKHGSDVREYQAAYMKNRDAAMEALNRANMYGDSDDPRITKRIDETQELIELGGAVRGIQQALSDIRKEEIAIIDDKDLSTKEKHEMRRELDQQRIELMREWSGAFYRMERGK